jgi:hypothetical protein
MMQVGCMTGVTQYRCHPGTSRSNIYETERTEQGGRHISERGVGAAKLEHDGMIRDHFLGKRKEG